MQDTKRIWVWVGVAVVVIAVAVAFIWKPGTKAPTVTKTSLPVVYASQGQLTPQFPKELILDSMSNVTSSYSISYSSTTNQYTAVFNSSSSMSSLYNLYTKYFTNNHWTIINSITKYPSSRGLYAKNTSSSVAVAIVSQGTGAQVTISFLTQ